MTIKYRPEILPPISKILLEVKPLEFTTSGPTVTVNNGGKAVRLMQEYAAKYNLYYGIFCDGELLIWSSGGIQVPENLPPEIKNKVHYANHPRN